MASLDKIEGELVEGLILVVLIILAVIGYTAWKGATGFKLPPLSEILSKIQAGLNDFLNGAIDRLAPSPNGGESSGPRSDVQVYTGTNEGQSAADGGDITDYQSKAGPSELDQLQ